MTYNVGDLVVLKMLSLTKQCAPNEEPSIQMIDVVYSIAETINTVSEQLCVLVLSEEHNGDLYSEMNKKNAAPRIVRSMLLAPYFPLNKVNTCCNSIW